MWRGQFVQPDAKTPPPIGINLVVVFAGLAVLVAGSPTLRRLLANQRNLIRLNVWRLEGDAKTLTSGVVVLSYEPSH